MIKQIRIFFTFFAIFSFIALVHFSCKKQAPLASVESGFRAVPDSIRIGAYWYWLSDNISKEGVINDLHAMKEAGITRVFIGNIGIDNLPYGEVKIFSPEWWEAIHAALKTATELDIEMGIFNSPGWSQSGGPWVKPEQSMRYLSSTDTHVTGPKPFNGRMPGYADDTQLVRVIAYPARANPYRQTWNVQKIRNVPFSMEMPVDNNRVIRSFVFQTNSRIQTNAELQAKVGDEYKTIRKFVIDRTNFALNVGFDPHAPIVLSLPETQTTSFRLLMDASGVGEGTAILSDDHIVERYPEQTLAKMYQRPLPYWPTYMWPRQDWYQSSTGFVISPDEVIDVTAFLSADGVFKWDVPEGNWTISLLEMKTTGVTNSPATPEATGLEVDKMSKKHVAAHFDAFLGEIMRRVPAEDRKTFRIAVQDSYETGGLNWTDDMAEVFTMVYGYDPVPFLPTLQGKIVGNEDISSRFLWDLRRLIADRVAYDYVGGLREICHQHGLTTWLENYGHWGFPGEFLQYGGQSDEVAGEFWSVGELGDIENRAASSAAHIYGKRRVWSESCTSGGPNFGRYPNDMKQRIDRFFTEGINASLLHLYIHQPYEDRNPGMSAWFGNDFHRKNTWFSQMGLFIDYLRRSNFMLQQGTYVADVAYFIGECAPKMTGVEDPKLPKGYQFDYINAEVLMTRATVKNGRLTLPDGMNYGLLVLPNQQSMRPELLEKIKFMVADGLAIYGDAPVYSPSLSGYPEADLAVQHFGKELFANSTYGKGKVFRSGTDLQQALDDLGILPDFKTANDAPFLYIRRTLDDGEIYFVSNQSAEKQSFECTFRVGSGMRPELWNPVTAEIRHLPVYQQTANSTTLLLEFDALESSFIVFRKGSKASGAKSNFPPKEVLHTVNTTWQVSFEKGKRGPETPVTFNILTDWKDSDNEQIKFFAGEAVYTTYFSLDKLPSKELYIDFGKIMVMGQVTLNGQYVGGVWTYPYRLNVTNYLQKGENRLEVTVVNNWQNRLIGDQRLPENERPTWTPVNPWRINSPLQASGLLGPVEIQAFEHRAIIE